MFVVQSRPRTVTAPGVYGEGVGTFLTIAETASPHEALRKALKLQTPRHEVKVFTRVEQAPFVASPKSTGKWFWCEVMDANNLAQVQVVQWQRDLEPMPGAVPLWVSIEWVQKAFSPEEGFWQIVHENVQEAKCLWTGNAYRAVRVPFSDPSEWHVYMNGRPRPEPFTGPNALEELRTWCVEREAEHANG